MFQPEDISPHSVAFEKVDHMTKAKFLGNLKKGFQEADVDSDNQLVLDELVNMDPALYETLGFKNASALLDTFDSNGDKCLDQYEQQDLLRNFIPALKKDMNLLAAPGERADFVGVAELRASVDEFKQIVQQYERKQHTQHTKVQRDRFSESILAEQNRHHEDWAQEFMAFERAFDAKEARILAIYKFKLIKMLKDAHAGTLTKKGEQLKPKMPPHVLEKQKRLHYFAKAREYDKHALTEAATLQKELRIHEEQADAEHEVHKKEHIKREIQKLFNERDVEIRKIQRMRCDLRSKLKTYHGKSSDILAQRHKNYNDKLNHDRKISAQHDVLFGLNPKRALPIVHVNKEAVADISKGFAKRHTTVLPPVSYVINSAPPGSVFHSTKELTQPMGLFTKPPPSTTKSWTSWGERSGGGLVHRSSEQ